MRAPQTVEPDGLRLRTARRPDYFRFIAPTMMTAVQAMTTNMIRRWGQSAMRVHHHEARQRPDVQARSPATAVRVVGQHAAAPEHLLDDEDVPAPGRHHAGSR